MSEPKPRRRRTRLILLVLVNCVAVTAAMQRIQYVRSPEYQRSQATSAIQRQAWSTAEIHLLNFIVTSPDDAESRLALADVYRELAKNTATDSAATSNVEPPLGIEQLLEVARLRPDNTAVRSRLFATYVASGQLEAATQVAQQLAALGSRQPNVLERATRAALDTKNWGEAESLLERLKEIRTDPTLTDLVMAVRLHEGRGDTEKLEALLHPMVLKLSGKTSFQLEGVAEADIATIGFLLRAAVRWAPDGSTAAQRFIQSFGVLEQLANTPVGKSKRPELVEIGAQLLAVAKPVSTKMWERLQLANEQFYKFAEPVLNANEATPLVYEQLSRLAVDSKDPTRALSILRRGIDQHRQLPPERQRELLALHGRAAQLLLSQFRFAEAQTNLVVLLEHPETASLGNLLAAAVALEEGRFEEADNHLKLAQSTDGDPTMLEALKLRVYLATSAWKPALQVLEELDRRWETMPVNSARWFTTFVGGREQVRFLQSQCLARLGESEKAEGLLQQLERGPLRVQVQQARMLTALQRGQRREAWEMLRGARREFPDDQRLVWIEFSLLVDEKAPEGATRLLAGHIRRFPQDLSSRLLISQWLIQRGETVSALQQLAEIRQLFPNLPIGWLLTSDLLLNSGRSQDLDNLLKDMRNRPTVAQLMSLIQARRSLHMAGLNEAEAALREASPELQRTAAFNVMSAVVSLSQGNAEQAFDLYARSLRFTGIRVQVRDGFLQSFEKSLRTANPETLGQQIEELRKQYPDEPAVLLASAEMAIRRRDFEIARQHVSRLADVDTVPGRPEYTLARLQIAIGQPGDGLVELQRAIEKAPQHQAARLLAARLAFAQGDFKSALDYLDSLLPPAADELLPTLLRAESLVKLERFKEAEQVLIQLTLRHPKPAQGWLALSSLRSLRGQADAAAKTLEEGLTRTSDSRSLQQGLIELLLRSQKTGPAVAAARRFCDGSKDPKVYLYWAKVFLSANQFQATDDWLKQAREYSNPPASELLFFEALALHQRAISEPREGLFQEARNHYSKLLEQYPEHVAAMNNLAWLLLRHFNEPTESLAVVEQLQIVVPFDRMTPELLDTVIEVYSRLGRRADVAEIVDKSIARFPNSAVLRMQYGATLIQEAGDDPDRLKFAKEQLERARSAGLPPHRQADMTVLLALLQSKSIAD